MRLLILVLAASSAAATNARAEPCPEGNLLAGHAPVRRVLENPGLLTDGIVTKTGDPIRSPLTTRLRSSDDALIYDLGRVVRIHAVLIQAQGDATFEISVSPDGRDYLSLWEVPPALYGRMHTRHATGLAGEGRFLRLSQRGGLVGKAISELQAYCVTPNPWPPTLDERDGQTELIPRKRFKYWGKLAVGALALLIFVFILVAPTQKSDEEQLLAWRLAAGSGAALLAFTAVWTFGVWGPLIAAPPLALWGYLGWRHERGSARERLIERGALVIVMVASAVAYTNFGTFHGNIGVHLWDSFHYVVGAKYFPENGYTGLYHCSLLAEVDNGRGHEMSQRRLRDLENNIMRPAPEVLAEPHPCRPAFSDERWQAFRQDVGRFRRTLATERWVNVFSDHGFNATPVWLIMGHAIANWGWQGEVGPPLLDRAGASGQLPAAERQRLRSAIEADGERFLDRLGRLALLDGILWVGCFALLLWAFGLRACALAIVVWGTGQPWAYDWTGGSFGRVPWIFMAVAGVALTKKGGAALGGYALAGSMLLRVFPGALAGGLVLKALWVLIKRRRTQRSHRRLLFGAVIALTTVVPLSIPLVGGADTYTAFIDNSMKHRATPLTNHIGLDTILSWSPTTGARFTKDTELDDHFAVWKQKRQETLADRWPLRWLLIAGLFALVAAVAVRVEDWEAIAISGLLIFSLFELTSYYYAFLILMAPVALRALRYVVPYIWLAIIGQGVASSLGWHDEANVVQSLLILAFYLYVLIDILVRAPSNRQTRPTPSASP